MPELVNKLEEKMKRDNARHYAKRFTTTSSIIGKNSAIFCSDSLFSRHSNPQKIYVFFIEGDNFVGRRTKNPYKFSRKWPAASALTTTRTDGRREGANEPTSTAFIKGIRMTINGSPIDSMTTKGSEDDDEIAFARWQIFNTFLASPFTSGISYEDFMNGCYVWCADIRNGFIICQLKAKAGQSIFDCSKCSKEFNLHLLCCFSVPVSRAILTT
ncbi:uncharacterized protein LOC131892557 [Tigriopus californicus]|uniref:uncharacterized protein LOC131892557 n=1 Tax=Tigriopus californicus TaxID=6832 RepID=UPI0027DA7594|nr:uncharacterized protein LOC131892557 [Tigriopus californicus]